MVNNPRGKSPNQSDRSSYFTQKSAGGHYNFLFSVSWRWKKYFECIFQKIIMQYCINALLKNINEIMQYYIINNDIALIMHYCALLQIPELD